VCGRDLAADHEAETCRTCGSKLGPHDHACPDCGSLRDPLRPPTRRGVWAAAAVALLLLLYMTVGRAGRGQGTDAASADPIFTSLPIIMPSPSPTNPVVIHEVAEGESLGSIAVQYGVDRAAIANANQISTNAMLQLG
jgi:ribosomal protein L32